MDLSQTLSVQKPIDAQTKVELIILLLTLAVLIAVLASESFEKMFLQKNAASTSWLGILALPVCMTLFKLNKFGQFLLVSSEKFSVLRLHLCCIVLL